LNLPSKQKDLPAFITVFGILYQKNKVLHLVTDSQSKTPEADNADIGVAYDNEE
jgi:hypothetical protein